jgi:hypothetical protein
MILFSANKVSTVSVPAVAVQTIRPFLEQNNAVTTGSDKIDLPVLSKCTNTSTYTMKPKPSNIGMLLVSISPKVDKAESCMQEINFKAFISSVH